MAVCYGNQFLTDEDISTVHNYPEMEVEPGRVDRGKDELGVALLGVVAMSGLGLRICS